MPELSGFNVRVYALCIQNNSILTLYEPYAGIKICKLPGGGLDYGEGTLECLHREFKEELNVKIEITGHFYTQDVFLLSRIKDNKQILNIYYTVTVLDIENLVVSSDTKIEKLEWVPIDGENPFVLEADIIAFEKLQKSIL